MAIDVKFRTTLEDYVAFCRHHYRHSRTARVRRLVGWLLPPLACLLYAASSLPRDGWNSPLVLWLLAGAVAWLAVHPFIHNHLMDSYVRSYASEGGTRGVFGDIRLILSEEALVMVTETIRTEASWGDVHRIDDQGDYTFIYVTPLAAQILPRRGFESEQEYKQVKEYAKECFTRSRAQEAL